MTICVLWNGDPMHEMCSSTGHFADSKITSVIQVTEHLQEFKLCAFYLYSMHIRKVGFFFNYINIFCHKVFLYLHSLYVYYTNTLFTLHLYLH